MSTTTKQRKPRSPSKRRHVEPAFISKAELAAHCRVDTATIDKWVSAGTFPPAHSVPGDRTYLWRRIDFDAYFNTGRWPEESYSIGRSRPASDPEPGPEPSR